MQHPNEDIDIEVERRRCIQDCRECHDVLQTALTRCLMIGGEHAQFEHIRLLLDGADSCHISANFLLRESPSAGYFCGVCARLCDRCADECERLGNLTEFVEACRRCAKSCHLLGQIPPEGI